jgi:major intracellular serine protease
MDWIVRKWYDLYGSNPNIFLDYNGHGIHVAGKIAAQKNDKCAIGIPLEASLLIVKVSNKNGKK